MSLEKYALNWNSHADHLKQAFSQILEAHNFVDVTISCEGKKIKAHRIILSAFSPYFYDILKDNPCDHPTIVLRDIKYNNINYLLKFMYCGEVQVPTEHFNSFLQTAEFLQISGLTDSDNKTDTSNINSQDAESLTEKPKVINTTLKESGTINKKRSTNDISSIHCKKKKDENSESEENISESESREDTEVNNVMKSMSMENIPNIQELLDDKTYLSKDANPECECPICAEKFTTISILKQHMPFHMGETKCQICGKIMSRLDILRKHLATVHKIQSNTMKKVER